MTVQEAIKAIQVEGLEINGKLSRVSEFFEGLVMAEDALETMEEMKKRNITTETILEYAKFEDECIHKGFTLKSLLEAREKQTKKRPNFEADGYADGVLVYDYAECPICGHDFEYGINDWGSDYCQKCGQKLDWDEENNETDSLEISFENLNLSTRTYNCLKRARINTIEELCKKTPEDMMRIRDFGRKSLDELLDKMKEHGLKFREGI